MEYKIEASKKNTQFLEHFMPKILEQLKLEDNGAALLIKVSNDDMPADHDGGAFYLDIADCYVVLLKKYARMTTDNYVNQLTSLCHEMVHIKQMVKGTLRTNAKGNRVWRGKVYSKKTKYLDMPWEVDAFSKQELLTRRVMG
jgi:hypothetical protein